MSCWERIVKFNADWRVGDRIKILILGETLLPPFSSNLIFFSPQTLVCLEQTL